MVSSVTPEKTLAYCWDTSKMCIRWSLGMALIGQTPYLVVPFQGAAFGVSIVTWTLVADEGLKAYDREQGTKYSEDDTVLLSALVAANALAIFSTVVVVKAFLKQVKGKVSYGALIKPSLVNAAVFVFYAFHLGKKHKEGGK